MQVLLRTKRIGADGIVEYLDTEIDAAAVTLGSAPDQTLQLIGPNIAAEHAQIRLAGDRANIRCRRGLTVAVNGTPVRSAALQEGDRIEIDGHRLQRVAPPPGFDLAFELTPNADVKSSDFALAFHTTLAQTWLSKRRVAWFLFVVISAATLLVPLGTLVWHHGDAHRPWLPADAQWSPGALHPAHQLAIGDDCNACHAVPFVRVADAACTACHDRTHDHIDAAAAASAQIEHIRCATCHQEHHEPPQLVVTSAGLCTDCHATPERFKTIAQFLPASGFTSAKHPAFKAHLLRSTARPVGTGAGGGSRTGLMFDWRFEPVAIAGATETSNLRFPHDVHLDGEKVQRVADSAPLHCADCHELAPDKEHFLPVTMERHCASCHDLGFDTTDPTRVLPHGQPTEAILTIEGHYLRKFGDPNLAATAPDRRRLPDHPDAAERCDDTPYACAMRKTRDEAVNQFTKRGCVTCHRVDDTGSSDIFSRFQVYPIRLVTDYLPMARFDHASHLTQKDASGDAACGSCHDAVHSKDSADLLIPDIDNCVQCHSDRPAAGGIALPCTACHSYHPLQAAVAARGQP